MRSKAAKHRLGAGPALLTRGNRSRRARVSLSLSNFRKYNRYLFEMRQSHRLRLPSRSSTRCWKRKDNSTRSDRVPIIFYRARSHIYSSARCAACRTMCGASTATLSIKWRHGTSRAVSSPMWNGIPANCSRAPASLSPTCQRSLTGSSASTISAAPQSNTLSKAINWTSPLSNPDIAFKPRARCPEIGMAQPKGLIGSRNSGEKIKAPYFWNFESYPQTSLSQSINFDLARCDFAPNP